MFEDWIARVGEVNSHDIHPNQAVRILLGEPAGELAEFVLLVWPNHLLG